MGGQRCVLGGMCDHEKGAGCRSHNTGRRAASTLRTAGSWETVRQVDKGENREAKGRVGRTAQA